MLVADATIYPWRRLRSLAILSCFRRRKAKVCESHEGEVGKKEDQMQSFGMNGSMNQPMQCSNSDAGFRELGQTSRVRVCTCYLVTEGDHETLLPIGGLFRQ